MPLTHQCTFAVRSYEVDLYGHVNNAQYLRYMQEAAISASSAVGYDEARYVELGSVWLIRELEIEYLQPLKMGDSIEMLTWVGDFRRVRSRRYYELRKGSTGDLVAKANVDWVYLDRVSQRPLHLSDEMIVAFAPDPADRQEVGERRERFPAPPPPPPKPYIMQRRVEWRDVDNAGHVNNANYLNFMEECAMQAAESVGVPLDATLNAEHLAIIARRHHIEYRQQATYGEQLTVTTYLSNLRRSMVTRHFLVHHASDGALLTQANSLYVCVNTKSGMPVRFPAEMTAKFINQLADASAVQG
jgi:acyl-CoA thioester hydrolase